MAQKVGGIKKTLSGKRTWRRSQPLPRRLLWLVVWPFLTAFVLLEFIVYLALLTAWSPLRLLSTPLTVLLVLLGVGYGVSFLFAPGLIPSLFRL
jgi:sterol desaturase/sphingolipid hydroxylase (fatty acid hydroxylase superfamily)